ncbi:hypothetical protein BDR26DRAFT_142639 [Obelidium mucronatum]|nr:hypothetical protein BDR26DRAFT_142639 [Obelidium mucronatum]
MYPPAEPSRVSDASQPVRAAQFALAPHSITTTVVTTTTTKITEFPPLLIEPSHTYSGVGSKKLLKNLRALDVSEFPLANTPTPPALKKFCFDLNGVPTRFTELDLFEDDLQKLNSSKHDNRPSASATPSITSNHFQHHTRNLPTVHNNNSFSTDKPQTSPLKNIRKRDHRGASFTNASHGQNPGAADGVLDLDATQPVPLTPFPDLVVQTAAANLPPIITAVNTINSPVNVVNNNPLLLGLDETPNLPSPTMSPTATTPPPHAFALPGPVLVQHFRSGNNTGPTSPVPNHRQRDLGTTARSLTTSPTTRYAPSSLPSTLSDIPSIINTFDALAPQLQSYLLLQLLRRCSSKTLQFVSTLILPALKQDFLGDLPAELAYQILGRLDLRTLSRVSRVCKKWRGVVDGEGAGIAVWKQRLSMEGWFSEGEVKGILERFVMWRRSLDGKMAIAKDITRGNHDSGSSSRRSSVGASASQKVIKSPGVLKLDSDDMATKGMLSGGAVSMKRSADSLNSASTAFTHRVGDEVVGLGLGSFRSTNSNLRRHAIFDEDDDREEDYGADRYSLAGSSHDGYGSDCDYEFEEDEAEDYYDANQQVDDGDANASKEEFLSYFASSQQCPTIVQDTVDWMKTLNEFSTSISDVSSSGASMYGNTTGKAFGRGSKRLRISRARSRLRKFIEECSKSELSRLALQVPHLYKGIYRRHHIIRRNWARGAQQTTEFPGHGNNVVTCLQFDNDKIVSGSDDQTIHIYDTKSGTIRRKLVGHDGGVWALQYWGDSLVSGSTDRSVRVWDMDTGLCTHLFEGHTSTVRCLMIVTPSATSAYPFGTNGRNGGADFEPGLEPSQPLIVTGSRDATLRVWRLPNPKTDKYHVPQHAQGVVHTHGDENNTYESGQNPFSMHVLTGHSNSVRAIAGHGRVLVSGSYDHTVRVWDLINGDCVYTFRGHREKVYSVGYSHELSRAVSGSLDATVKVWCIQTGVLLHNLEGHTSLVGLLELSPEYLVSAAADQSLRIWAPGSGHCLAHLHGHTAAITCFHHDPKLNRIVSGSDGGVKLWELSSAVGGGLSVGSGSSAGTAAGLGVDGATQATGMGPGFEFRQGPNGPEPVYGRYSRDLVSGVAGVWRVRMDERRLVCAISKEGGNTWFQVLDFGENVKHGTIVQGTGDGGMDWVDDEMEEDEDEDGDDGVDDGDDGGEDDGNLPPDHHEPENPLGSAASLPGVGNANNGAGGGGALPAPLTLPLNQSFSLVASSSSSGSHPPLRNPVTRTELLAALGEQPSDSPRSGLEPDRDLNTGGTSSSSTSATRIPSFFETGASSSRGTTSMSQMIQDEANVDGASTDDVAE